MIVIGSIKGIVISSIKRGFDSKPTPERPNSKHYELNEITFFAPDINITGILKDWECTIPFDALRSGDEILVNFNRCSPTKGMNGVFDFTGYPTLVK